VSLPIGNITPFLPVIQSQPPFPNGIFAFDPNLKLPRSYQWNVALEKSFAGKQALSVSYVGQAGRDLLRREGLFMPNSSFSGEFQLNDNSARSNYNALQLQYRRPLSAHLQALANYTWSHSLDNASDDLLVGLANTIISGASDYASSGFDVRHGFSVALSYDIPSIGKSGPLSLLTRDWSLDAVIVARSGFPFNAFLILESADPGGFAFSRPDRVLGQPLWISAPNAPGGKILNSTTDPITGAVTGGAFAIPPTTPAGCVPGVDFPCSAARQGTEGRNDIPGFGLTQVDLSIGRKFPITERLNLQFRADAFNVLNHPNFQNPSDPFFELGPFFLQSQGMFNGAGGLNPLFQQGGPRSLQLSLKLIF